MDKISVKLTVYFENPYWVGIFERIIDGKLSVCKVTFGAEPKDNQILEFIFHNYNKLIYSSEFICESYFNEKINPKRILRNVKKQCRNIGVGTKSQQVLKFQQEENKQARKIKKKKCKEIENEEKYTLRRKKKREKHKGK